MLPRYRQNGRYFGGSKPPPYGVINNRAATNNLGRGWRPRQPAIFVARGDVRAIRESPLREISFICRGDHWSPVILAARGIFRVAEDVDPYKQPITVIVGRGLAPAEISICGNPRMNL